MSGTANNSLLIRDLEEIALQIRMDIVEEVYLARSGHPGGSLSAADIMTVLYFYEMNIDPHDVQNPDRDRFVLSKCHAAPAYYAALAERGYFDRDLLASLRKTGSILQGHPDRKHIPGVDMSSGSLGQGISAAVGMAMAARLQNRNYRVFALLGDGELEEGQVWEAFMFAGNHDLDNLIVLIDNNNLQIDGSIETVNSPHPIDAKLKAFHFNVITVEDGNDISQIVTALDQVRIPNGKPTALILQTVKGKGIDFMEDQVCWHGKAPDNDQFRQALECCWNRREL